MSSPSSVVHELAGSLSAGAGDRVSPVAREGLVIGGRYRLEQALERGAMGALWRAEHVLLRAPVAVKFLDTSLVGDTEMHQRFLLEARAAAAVRSAHVVQVFDYGVEGSVPYIVMELLEGENLDARLTARGCLTPAELDQVFADVALALGGAHQLGIVHRDLKPGNIFIAREGEHEIVKLVDFGIAKVRADALRVTQAVGTQIGTLLGTPQYMSPEQIRGAVDVDHRSDLWALAIIACECLTGRYPFSAQSIGDLTVQICTEKPIPPSRLGPVPAGFDQWFSKATHRLPAKRFGSAREMAAELHVILRAAATEVGVAAAPGGPEVPRGARALAARAHVLAVRVRAAGLALLGALAGVLATLRTRAAPWIGAWSHARADRAASALLTTLCGVAVVLWWSSGSDADTTELPQAHSRFAREARETRPPSATAPAEAATGSAPARAAEAAADTSSHSIAPAANAPAEAASATATASPSAPQRAAASTPRANPKSPAGPRPERNRQRPTPAADAKQEKPPSRRASDEPARKPSSAPAARHPFADRL